MLMDSIVKVSYLLNEKLGRHRGREGKVEGTLCGAECESVIATCVVNVLVVD